MAMDYYQNHSNIDVEQMEKFGCTEMTPALRYAGTSSFEEILTDIRNGDIPTGTGEPFPVVWKNDNDMNLETMMEDRTPNWTGSNNGFINPLPQSLQR